MNNLVNRFLHYTSFDTQSDETSVTFPSTRKQFVLAHELDEELKSLGLTDSSVDPNGYVTATLPANCESPDTVPVIAFLAHMDTSPDASGTGVKPRIVTAYDGGDILLNAERNMILSPTDFPDMLLHKGEDFIVADGTTLLGADDKAGIAEIMTAVEYLLSHPEVKHGTIKIAFTPDEEVGQGVDRFDLAKFGANYAFTLDGDELGSLEYENFNAASAEFEIVGKSIHPGAAKGIMKNAALIAAELTTLFPSGETPRSTEKYEGFFHLTRINGVCEKARAKYIIRDHDKHHFEDRKSMAHVICDFLNAKYDEDTVTVHVRDSYYNMHEVIEQNMILIDVARGVMEKLGIAPLVKPVRGGTDGARLSYMGLPCPNLFTGGRNYHGPLEYIVRDHDKHHFEQRKSMTHAICDFLNAKYGEDTVTVHVRDSYYNMREVIEQNMLLVDIARGVMEKLGIVPLVKPVRGGTDGARLSYMGLPCPNLFTGGRNYHGPLEYVVIQSMEKAVQVIVGIAEAFATRSATAP